MNIKSLFLLFLAFTFFNTMVFGQQKDKKFKIVIDAGHGGEDPGCLGKKMQEKTVNLNVALKLGKLISDNYDDVQVIYTRKTDVFVEVYKRAVIANNNHADLFVSIHCNAAENHAAHGVETWVMGLAKTGANTEVVRKENAAILKEKNFENNYDGFNPNSPEANIIFSLHTSAYMNHSILLADKVQKNLVKSTHFSDRLVNPGGFWVLYKVAMPSILVELGFLSNPTEEEFMIKPSSQDLMAVSIYNAFVEYRNALDGTHKAGLPLPNATSTQVPQAKTVDDGVAAEPSTHRRSVDDAVAAEPSRVQQPSTDPEVAAEPVNKEQKTSQNSSSENNKATTPKQTETAVTPAAATPTTPQTTTTSSASTQNTHNVRFRVQFAAVPENISITDSRFANLKEVRKYHEGKFWKYTTGNAKTLAEAKEILKSVQAQYKDAFLVAFDGETKIPVSQAVELCK